MIYLTQIQLSYIMIGFHNLKNTGGNYEKQNYMGKCEFNNSTLKGLVGDIITYSKQNINNTNISSSINPIYKEIEGRYFVMSDFDNLSITIYPN